MRIAWCTPFSPESAIGLVSAMAVEELAQRDGIEVDVWHPAQSGGRVWSGTTKVLDPDQVDELATYDAVVYHLGDHSPNHLHLWQASLQVPGLVVLHDVALGNLFHGFLIERGAYPAEFGLWYGPEVRDRAEAALAGEPGDAPWLDEGGAAYPFLSLATRGARHVVVHSQYAARAVAPVVLAEVDVVGLPVLPSSDVEPALLDGVPTDVPIVLQAGMFNPNKRIDTVVAAVAELARSRPMHLVVAGRPGVLSMQELHELVRAQGLTDVTVVENPSDATLAGLRARADVAVALRQPCLEGASYAMLESLAAGLPVVAADDGSYAEVTGPFIEHVPTPPTSSDVATALASLLDRETAVAAEAAHAYVREQHTAATYADGILRVLRDRTGAGPRHRLVHGVGRVLGTWGLADIDGVVDTVAQRMEELFAAEPVVPPVR